MLGLGAARLEADMNRLMALLFHQGVLDEQFMQLQQLQDESSPNFVSEVISIYFRESEKLLKNLRSLLADRECTDYRKIGIHLNQLMGSSSSVGAKRVRTVCLAFRAASEHNNWSGYVPDSYNNQMLASSICHRGIHVLPQTPPIYFSMFNPMGVQEKENKTVLIQVWNVRSVPLAYGLKKQSYYTVVAISVHRGLYRIEPQIRLRTLLEIGHGVEFESSLKLVGRHVLHLHHRPEFGPRI
ncbi:uncharacterized protein [Elaeis guineensis]|uniref:Histidine-containing phosphotransfer protein n=1 Tax=Elaeis guineensis var. tenera TaxID=51953 RepID=A0A6I9QHZ4_ELAGV|nr:uncharacterized protein LOC105035874 isoform X2 [Elaeis guineensis]